MIQTGHGGIIEQRNNLVLSKGWKDFQIKLIVISGIYNGNMVNMIVLFYTMNRIALMGGVT